MSNKHHEHENSFLIISKIGLNFHVRFGCYRYCNKNAKTYHIGTITVSNNKIDYIDPQFLVD